ncbi:response regulator [Roseateles cavernae]|uniref:response regulator n=1 Tax=Roseateles cavernae TaxID=3153578 RepID=UPI0032E37814
MRARVLLIEDEPSIRRFVGIALDDLPIELVCADGLTSAMHELQGSAEPFSLVLCDLMLADGSGLELLRQLARSPNLRRGAELVVLSAGLNSATRGELEGIGLFRMLAKPVPLAELRACVIDAVEVAPTASELRPDDGLLEAFRTECLAQFDADIAAGDQARQSGDAAALRRLGHNLKTVLATLQWHNVAAEAETLERAAQEDSSAVDAAWLALRSSLLELRECAGRPGSND